MNEEDYQIPAAFRLTKSSVDILSHTVALLNEAELRTVAEDFLHLVLLDVVLLPQLLNDVFEPDEAGHSHGITFDQLRRSPLVETSVRTSISQGAFATNEQDHLTACRPSLPLAAERVAAGRSGAANVRHPPQA